METIGIRTKKSWAGPGMEAFDAELTIWDDEKNGYLYIHVNQFMGSHFTVADYSMFDYLTGQSEEAPTVDYIEEYESLVDAIQSRYLDGFILLDNILNEMQDLTYNHRESVYSYIVSDIDWDEDVDDEDIGIVTGDFLYQNKSMDTPVKRQVKGVDNGGDRLFQMMDESGAVLESFDDVEATSKSRWSLLYAKINENLDEIV